MSFLLDGTNFPGSDANTSLPQSGGDVFPGNSAESADPANPVLSTASNSSAQKDKTRLIEEAKSIMRRGIGRAPGRLAAKVGAPKEVVKAFGENSPQAREEVKDFAKKKAREFVKDKIGDQLKGGIKKGFEKGIKEGAAKAIKEGGKQVAKGAAKQVGKAVGKGLAKGAAKVAAKGAAKIGSEAAVEGGVAAVGAATGAVTFGLGFVLSLLLDIAISLGVNDAVDALFELKEGNVKHATFLAIRGAVKIGVFIWLLVTVVSIFSVGGIFFGIFSLFVLNIYMILGSIPAFKGIPHLQGLVMWEKLIIVMIDIVAFLTLILFIGGIAYYLCQTTGLGGGGVSGALAGVVARTVDWWYGGSGVGADFVENLCTQIMKTG